MDSKKMDLNLLQTLVVLLEECNVTKAADRLNLSQPAVSTQLSRLRGLFDDQLLVPIHKGMLPTAKAIALLPELRTAMKLVSNVLVEHQDFTPETANLTFKVACTDYIQLMVMAKVIQRLKVAAPNIKVVLCHLKIATLAVQLQNSELDLALMSPECGPDWLRFKILYQEKYVLIGRKLHPQLKPKITIADYVKLEHIVISFEGSSTSTFVDSILQQYGKSRQVMTSVPSFLLVPELVKNTDLVALIPARQASKLGADFTIVDNPIPDCTFDVAMVWHEVQHQYPALRWLRAFISQTMAEVF
ncbi:LysR family transcriptional regulator [Pseudoalteromonas peptidolytica]|uniref:LysR family transcriptional regulator n=1 Tax=Pseudoalteromonas peptidolytica TaxID=61150 RepID=UPI00298E50FD|nr:LysR family transcriptional regulator [Pseudoalteromonas peptidolytica]MDW7549766.1 LysR family transcriptional regulator [Pseudoalteromonas peptidolytica]